MTLDKRKSLAPWIKDDIVYYDHQIEGIRKLAGMRSFLLADDMGLGKSLQALTVFGIDVFQGRATSAIVICPATLKGNWVDEIDHFTTFERIELGKAYNKKGKPRAATVHERRLQLLEFKQLKGAKILVVNYEQVQAHLLELQALKFDIAIFDEAHYLKNPKAKRTAACMELYTPRSFLLTGSPMLNKVDELWPLLWRIDKNAYPDYYSFKARYCVMGGYKNKEIIGVQNEQELTLRLQSVMLRRLKDDVLKLKKPYIVKRNVDLTDLQRKMYDEVLNEMRLTLPEDLDNPMDIDNGMTKFLRLKQICGTTATLTTEDSSGKLDLVMTDGLEILKNGRKLIVFTQFREVQAAYERRVFADPELKNFPMWELHGDIPIVQRQDVVKAWSNHPGPAIIVCMLQVAGIGLNMVAARDMQFIDKLFVPKLNQQAVDRAHRIGQDETQAVQVLEYIARDTVEKRVEEINVTKTKLFNDVVETSAWKRLLLEEAMKDV